MIGAENVTQYLLITRRVWAIVNKDITKRSFPKKADRGRFLFNMCSANIFNLRSGVFFFFFQTKGKKDRLIAV